MEHIQSLGEGGDGFRVKRWSRGAGRATAVDSPLSPEGRLNLGRMVIDSVHRAELSTGVDLPCKTGILGEVFGEPGRLLPSLRYEACEVPMMADPMAASAKRPRLRAPTTGALHANIIRRGQLVSRTRSWSASAWPKQPRPGTPSNLWGWQSASAGRAREMMLKADWIAFSTCVGDAAPRPS